jgi:hypothetical protein
MRLSLVERSLAVITLALLVLVGSTSLLVYRTSTPASLLQPRPAMAVAKSYPQPAKDEQAHSTIGQRFDGSH